MVWPTFKRSGEEEQTVARPAKLKIKTVNIRAKGVKAQATPIHDFINFKKMSGNEIILNLENHDNLTNSELVSGLMELGKKDNK